VTGTAFAPVGQRLARTFFAPSVNEVAPQLVGATLLVDGVGGTIVEVEAYAPHDPASHSYGGRTVRNAAMFGPPGRAYVYRSYGVHWCLNLVCEEEGVGAAVLIRALAPTNGLEAMRARRGTEDERLLCTGPGRLTEALGITLEHDAQPLDLPPFALYRRVGPIELVTTQRIGITRGAELPWRYALRGSRHLSRPAR